MRNTEIQQIEKTASGISPTLLKSMNTLAKNQSASTKAVKAEEYDLCRSAISRKDNIAVKSAKSKIVRDKNEPKKPPSANAMFNIQSKLTPFDF